LTAERGFARMVPFAAAVALGLAFGAVDQYVGSLAVASRLGFWTISVSLMSAPWLLLPFLSGLSQSKPPRAAAIGLVAICSALLGYFAMIVLPFEGGVWSMTTTEIRGLLLSNRENIVGGLITAPLYGVLGQRWRTRRSWLSLALVAGAFCLEPVAQSLAGRTYPEHDLVWVAEVLFGIALGALLFSFSWWLARSSTSAVRQSS